MALRVPVECSGETHELLIVSDGDGEHLDATLPNHNWEYDQAFEAMGGDRPMCYEYEELALRGMTAIFGVMREGDLSVIRGLLPAFLRAVGAQGVSALGLTQEEFVGSLVDYLEWRLGVYRPELPGIIDFLEIAIPSIPWLQGSKAFQRGLFRLAIAAYERSSEDAFEALSKLADEPLIRIKGTESGSRDKDGAGHRVRDVDVKVFIGDDEVDEWSFTMNGWFSDYGTMDWHTEKASYGDSPTGRRYQVDAWNDATERFLDVVKVDIRAFEEEYAPPAPKIPEYHYGDYRPGFDWAIVFNDDYTWGFFDNRSDAALVFSMMQDSHDFIGVGVGIFLRFMHRTGEIPDECEDCDEDGCDLDDPRNWEELDWENI
jgi:hypothetical protein